jgi:hypothetical protein
MDWFKPEETEKTMGGRNKIRKGSTASKQQKERATSAVEREYGESWESQNRRKRSMRETWTSLEIKSGEAFEVDGEQQGTGLKTESMKKSQWKMMNGCKQQNYLIRNRAPRQVELSDGLKLGKCFERLGKAGAST